MMFEYKSEIVDIKTASKGIKFVKTVTDLAETAKLDELLNKQAAEGWELVTHSVMVDNTVARIKAVVTFRRAK